MLGYAQQPLTEGTFPTVPHDICVNAITLECNAVTSGSTGGSTNIGAPLNVDGCEAAPGAGVWYTFVGDGSFHTLSTCGSAIDSKINIYTATEACGGGFIDTPPVDACDTLVTVNYSVGGGSWDSEIVWTLVDNLSGETVAMGGAPAAGSLCLAAGDYEFNMSDLYGDGWNGAGATFTNGLGDVILLASLDGVNDNGWDSSATLIVTPYSTDPVYIAGDFTCFASALSSDGTGVCTTFDSDDVNFEFVSEPGVLYYVYVGAQDSDGNLDTEDDGAFEIAFTCVPVVEGCTQFTACNYNSAANVDDGSCGTVPDSDNDGVCDEDEVPGCTLEFACNYNPAATDDDGSCEVICSGCTDVSACNYDSGANQDNGNCSYPENGFCDCDGNQLDALGVCGGSCSEDVDEDGICDDIDDCVGQYDECGICEGLGAIYACGCSDAPEGFCDCDGNVLDECGVCGGSGIPEGECDCNGNSLDECGLCGGNGIPEGECDCNGNTLDECGVCGGNGSSLDACGVCGGDNSSCTGCTYEFACNYDPFATILDVSLCEFGTCGGCTQSTACNYNPTVMTDDGSCEWCSCAEATNSDQNPDSLNIEVVADNDIGYWLELETVTTHVGGVLDGMTTFRLYMNMLNPLDYLASCSGDASNPMILNSSSGSWFNSPASTSWNAEGMNPLFFQFFPDLAFDSYLTLGAEDAFAPAAEHPNSIWGSIDASDEFMPTGNGSNITVDDKLGGAWYVSFPGIDVADTHVAFAGEDLRVLVAQFTTAGTMSGQIQVQVFQNGDQGQEFRDLLPICSGGGECGGCTEQFALNYAPDALYDDGSCYYSVFAGCMDPSASNYCEFYNIDDASCIYDYVGCTDSVACNYSPNASVSDEALCIYIQEGECDCQGNVYDLCGVCGGLGIPEGQCDCAGNIFDECGVCGGAGISEGECDCEGNVLDECGVCGGDGIPEGECDCEGNVLDECGVCGGGGIAVGACDCEGNVLDALGVCGGDCLTDQNNNGICDLIELENGVGGPGMCGLGTIWDEETQTCVVAYPADINFDGCVQLNDLLDLLASYGLCQASDAP